MKRTTIFADETLLNEVQALAREERRSVAEVIREALTRHVQQRKKKSKGLSYIGVAASGKTNIAERHEQLLWQVRPKHVAAFDLLP
jgi:metal-responsive CopG/Arc/MetJ family transcriptional regulator